MYRATLGHAHLKVGELERAIAFYTRFFGLRLVERVGDTYAFLTGGELHHEIALQEVGAQAPGPVAAGVGLYHVAFEVPDKSAFAAAYQALTAAGISVATVDHFISWALYFDDPDGNGLEIYVDTRQAPGGTPLWGGRNQPLPPETILAALPSAEADGG